jgi:ribose-phosphate pyrophosphokinase
MGVDNVIVVDWNAPRTGRLEGFFSPRVSVDHLRAHALGIEYLAQSRPLDRPVVVAPNETCAYLAGRFRDKLEARLGSPVGIASIIDVGSALGGVHRYLHDPAAQRLELVGDVRDRDVVIVDTLIDTAGTLVQAVRVLKARGARRIYAVATHGLFNGQALSRIAASDIDEIIVTDTIPLVSKGLDVRQTMFAAHARKVSVITIAPLLADAVLRMHTGMSLRHLREIIDEDDDTDDASGNDKQSTHSGPMLDPATATTMRTAHTDFRSP